MTESYGRSQRGETLAAEVLTRPLPTQDSPLLQASRDFVFGEVWDRPGLSRRDRIWATLTSLGAADAVQPMRTYLRAALASGIATREELDEFVLHFAVYCGWPKASCLQSLLDETIEILNKEGLIDLPPRALQPFAPGKPADLRVAGGQASFERIMAIPAPPRNSAYYHAGILNFVFGEMWDRPGLDQRARRIITVVAVAVSDAEIPILSHVYAAMKTGDLSFEELGELVLHFAVYSGWAKAEALELARQKMGAVMQSGQSLAEIFASFRL